MELYNLLLTVIGTIGVIIEICKAIHKLIKFVSTQITNKKSSSINISLKIIYK